MIMRKSVFAAAVGLSIGLGPPALAQTPGEDEAGVLVQQGAVDALKEMASALGALTTFRLTAITSNDDVLDNGQKLQIQGEMVFDVRAPDRLRAHIATDKQERTVYYDGSTFTQYAPTLDYYAVIDAPPTIAGMVLEIERKYALQMPLVDLFLWGRAEEPKVDLLAAYFAGRSTILGRRCNHYGYRVEGADVQIWLPVEGTQLPCRMVVTDLTEEARPDHEATLIWDTDAVIGDSTFSFVPPDSAAKIEQVPADAFDQAEEE